LCSGTLPPDRGIERGGDQANTNMLNIVMVRPASNSRPMMPRTLLKMASKAR
jgi:hypothetical protein